MPCYDYSCKKCDLTFEVTHSMNDKPIVICPKCQSRETVRIFSPVGFITRSGHNIAMQHATDQVKRNCEMKNILKTDLGIEKINPLGRSTMSQIYKDAMAQKSYIRESMSQQSEQSAAATKLKQKEWTRKALMRTEQRSKIRAEMKAKDAAEKRAIRI